VTFNTEAMAYKTAIEALPPDLLSYAEQALRTGTSTTDIREHLAARGYGHITARQLLGHQRKINLSQLEAPIEVIKAVRAGKVSLSSDDALLAVIGDALEQLDRLGAIARTVPNARLERILADTYPSVMSMLKEVSYSAGEIARVRALEAREVPNEP